MTAAAHGRLAAPNDAPAVGERTIELADAQGFRVEQILSGRVDAPKDYEQDHDEWVAVLTGSGVLDIDGVECFVYLVHEDLHHEEPHERVENDAEGSPYEAHMTKSDGSRVTVKVDSNFKVTALQADGH